MSYLNILQLIGGLSLFLFGMQLLSDGLTTVSGGRMEQLLGRFCSTKTKGVLLGTAVTGVIQSSSATTVMVVALVNSGVMLLRQAVPVIMGANIGTTVTGWLLSMTSISGSGIFINLLKPSSWTPILALVGIIMLFKAKTEVKKYKAYALLGFAVLMFGMDVMSSALAPLQHEPGFIDLFRKFSNPLLGVLVGALTTALIQSSSASVGILMALSSTGVIPFAAALPIIMGQNIGTCITAVLASIGTNRNAKRVAVVHLSFNIIGTLVFMLLFYIIHAVRPFPFMDNTVTPLILAIVHTTFNVFSSAILLPFSEQLIKLSKKIVPTRESELEELEEDIQLKLLDPRFLDRPAFALEQASNVSYSMLEIANNGMNLALDLLNSFSEEGYNCVEKWERQVDKYEDALSEYLIKISSGKLDERGSQKLTILMHAINDIERISDHSINLSDLARKNEGKVAEFSPQAKEEINVYTSAVREILQRTLVAFENLDAGLAFTIEPLEDRIDELNKKFTSKHIERLKEGSCNIEHGYILNEVYNVLERVADHCSNIGIYIMQYQQDDSLRVHDYAHSLDRSDDEYEKIYQHYVSKYPIENGQFSNGESTVSVIEVLAE
ncbi:MAG: Na/Pi cotransporter family protein [Eubacteriales bacterium]|nr:Na/Pi cotransporter family protein [Eubacteriales bacterium]